MIKERIAVNDIDELMHQLYRLAKEYPHFSGRAVRHHDWTDISATVTDDRETKTFAFVSDDGAVRQDLVDALARRGFLSGNFIDPEAIIRCVDRRTRGRKRAARSRSGQRPWWISLLVPTLVATAAAVVAAWLAGYYCSSRLSARITSLERDTQVLRDAPSRPHDRAAP